MRGSSRELFANEYFIVPFAVFLAHEIECMPETGLTSQKPGKTVQNSGNGLFLGRRPAFAFSYGRNRGIDAVDGFHGDQRELPHRVNQTDDAK